MEQPHLISSTACGYVEAALGCLVALRCNSPIQSGRGHQTQEHDVPFGSLKCISVAAIKTTGLHPLWAEPLREPPFDQFGLLFADQADQPIVLPR